MIAILASLDAGVNSDSYAGGMCEKLLGKFMRQDGRKVLVASKFTKSKWYDPGNYKSADDVIPALDNSLKNLGVDHLELYQLHYPEPRGKINAYLDALAEAVQKARSGT